jgi:hypothetical protein
MSLSKALAVVHDLHTSGVISSYAITGAVAALAYIEPTLTQDVDILVEVSAFDQLASGPLMTTKLDSALANLGYTERSDVGIVVEGWPIQFIPVANNLDAVSLENAHLMDINQGNGTKVFVLRPEYVVAKALTIGRPKDFDRVSAFLNQDVVDLLKLRAVILEGNLVGAWQHFCAITRLDDVLGIL